MNLLPQAIFERFEKLPIVREYMQKLEAEERKSRDAAAVELKKLTSRRETELTPLLEARAKARTAVKKAEAELQRKQTAERNANNELADAAGRMNAEQLRLETFLRSHQDIRIQDFISRCHSRRDELDGASPSYRMGSRDPLLAPNSRSILSEDFSEIRSAAEALSRAILAGDRLAFLTSDELDGEFEKLNADMPPHVRVGVAS